ncbi:MAG: hypothetical protein ACRYGK_18045 [Janthinobacterium lividum]
MRARALERSPIDPDAGPDPAAASEGGVLLKILTKFASLLANFVRQEPVQAENLDGGDDADTSLRTLPSGRLLYKQALLQQICAMLQVEAFQHGACEDTNAQGAQAYLFQSPLPHCSTPEQARQYLARQQDFVNRIEGQPCIAMAQQNLNLLVGTLQASLLEHITAVVRLGLPWRKNHFSSSFLKTGGQSMLHLLDLAAQCGIHQLANFHAAFVALRNGFQGSDAPQSTASRDLLFDNAVHSLLSVWPHDYLESSPWRHPYFHNWLVESNSQIHGALLYPLAVIGANCRLASSVILRMGAKLGAGIVLPSGWIVEANGKVDRFDHHGMSAASCGSILNGDLALGKGVHLLGPVRFGKNVVVSAGITLPAGVVIADNARIDALQVTSMTSGSLIKGNLHLTHPCTIGTGVAFGANVRVERNCRIGNDVTLGNNVHVRSGADIGAGCVVEDGLEVSTCIAAHSRVTLEGIINSDGQRAPAPRHGVLPHASSQAPSSTNPAEAMDIDTRHLLPAEVPARQADWSQPGNQSCQGQQRLSLRHAKPPPVPNQARQLSSCAGSRHTLRRIERAIHRCRRHPLQRALHLRQQRHARSSPSRWQPRCPARCFLPMAKRHLPSTGA